MSITPDLTSRVALVTGGSRGIGKAIALALAEAGADIAVSYRDRDEQAREVVECIKRAGRRAVQVAGDVADGVAVQDMVRVVTAQVGPIDILVNNAGLAIRKDLDELTEEDFDRTLAVNLKSAFLCTQAVINGMRARGWGRIVNLKAPLIAVGR